MILQILKIVACLGTIGTGLLGALRPSAVPGFTGLETTGPRGVTEIRSVFGGLFIGLGIFPLVIGAPETYQMLGVMYFAIGAVRTISMFLDQSVEQTNLISLAVEIVFGIVLVV